MILASVSTISTAIGRSNDRNRGLGGSRDPAFLPNRARDHGQGRYRTRNKYLERAALLPREAATGKVFGHAWCSRQASTPAADGLQSSQGLAHECVEVRIRTIAAASNGAAREGNLANQVRCGGTPLDVSQEWIVSKNAGGLVHERGTSKVRASTCGTKS